MLPPNIYRDEIYRNRDVDNTCDYTVHEVYRYAELLLAGDPRCVETLFLHPSSIHRTDSAWQQLVQHRQSFLTRACCEKYLRDAEGTRGLKLIQKLEKSGEALTDPMPFKVAKLFYIVIRLLQNAKEVAEDGDLVVYREDTSPEKALLVDVRAARRTHAELMGEVTRLQERIRTALQGFKDPDRDAARQVVEEWLLSLRFESLRQYMSAKT